MLEGPCTCIKLKTEWLIGCFCNHRISWFMCKIFCISWVRVTQGFVVPSESLFPWRFSVLLLDTQAGKFAVGPGTFTTARELFWYNCSPDCGSSAQLLHSGANGDLLQEYLSQTLFLTRLLQPEPLSPRQITADPCLPRRRSNIPRQVWL